MSQIPPERNPYVDNDSQQGKPAPTGADAWGEPPQTSGKAVASLILSLFSVFLCGIPGIIALILGFNGLSEIKNSQGRLTGSGFATSGIIIAFVSFAAMMFVIPVLLLLPAINAAREAARRNGCLSNVRQLSLANFNHESTLKRFPLGSDAAGPFAGDGAAVPGTHEGETAAGYSWQVKLLPFMEEDILYDEIRHSTDRFERHAFDPAISARGGHPAQVQLPLLRCPSNPGQDIATAPEYQRGVGNVAVGSYVGIPGTHIKSDGTLEENGVLVSKWSQRGGGGKGLRIHDISDGTAKTFLLCESREQRYSSWYDGQATWVTALRTDVDETDFLKGRGGFDGDFPKAPPDAAALNVGPGDYTLEGYFPADRYPGQQAREWGPSSNHGGVVIHGFVDGHAKTISVDVDPTTYMRFVTRAAGDPADAFQLE